MTFECIDVEKMYTKYEKLKKEDVKILQEWLKKQPHLPKLEELQVAAFLYSCYYRIETAKITIDNYFTMRTHHPEVFNPLKEDALRATMSNTLITILPKKTPQGYGILLAKLIDFKVDNFNFSHVTTLITMVTTLYLHQNGFENGGIVIFDSKGFTLSHLTRFNLTLLKHAMEFLQEAAPVRIKGVHFINIVPVLDRVVSMLKPMLKAEVFGLLQFHSSLDTLFKSVPLECLPEEYGGKNPSCQILQEENLKNLLNNYEFFEWHVQQKVDESKRTGKSKNDNMFGTEGTFKKLQID